MQNIGRAKKDNSRRVCFHAKQLDDRSAGNGNAVVTSSKPAQDL
jgi:hypothetical protein